MIIAANTLSAVNLHQKIITEKIMIFYIFIPALIALIIHLSYIRIFYTGLKKATVDVAEKPTAYGYSVAKPISANCSIKDGIK